MSRALIEVRRSRAPCARSPAWHGRGSGILLHHETRIGHTGHPHAGARHAVHLPRARRRAGGGGRAARLGGLRRAGAVRAPAGGGFRGGARRGGSPRCRKGRARTPRKRRTKRITASAPNTRMPARARAARVPASTWAGSSPSCARCPSRTSTRKAPRARSGSPSATWRRSLRACACSRRPAACRAWCARARAIGGWRNRPWARWTTAGWCPARRSAPSSRARTPSSRRPSWRPCARASCAWRS